MELCPQSRIDRSAIHLLSADETANLTTVAKALSDPLRLQMVHLLSQRDDLCTCEFEDLLDLGQSKVSYHLKTLLDAGIVDRELHGTWSHYRLRTSSILSQLTHLAAHTRQPELALR